MVNSKFQIQIINWSWILSEITIIVMVCFNISFFDSQ